MFVLDLRLIMGHAIFGLHEHVPRPSTYITILRKPSSLVVSQYRFVLRTPGHRHHEVVTEQAIGFADYIGSGMSLEMDDSQTRAIAGDLSTPFGGCTDAMLERAKANLDESFSVAGLTERFEETLVPPVSCRRCSAGRICTTSERTWPHKDHR